MPAKREPDDETMIFDEEVEHWLRTVVVPAYDEIDRRPENLLTVEQVLAHLAELGRTLSDKK